MAHTHSSTTVRSFTHLSDAERGEFSGYLKMGLTLSEIGRRMNRSISTLSRERKRGSVQQLDTNRNPFTAYFPDVGARVYRENRQPAALLLWP
jgi:IS30 family transposase